jgi:hypothetical protein
MSLTGTFQYVRIPANEQEPTEVLTADKSGGLSNDALVLAAKQYFFEHSGGNARAQQMQHASPAEKQALADQIRQQYADNTQLREMDNETLLNVFHNPSPSCDITALTVPVPANGHTAVSLYAPEDGSSAPGNARATALVTACGHGGCEIRGDVFVGRARDDEVGDVWERLDFTDDDAAPTAEWCRVARSTGGGGGQAGKAASSLSNLVTQQQQQAGGAGGMQVINTGGGQSQQALYGMNGAAPVQESWGCWTQSEDEVEVKFSVADGTKAKYCKVAFGRTSLKVTVAGQTLLQGATFDPIVVDDCTYTLQDAGDGRELCLTVAKTNAGRTWSWVVAKS